MYNYQDNTTQNEPKLYFERTNDDVIEISYSGKLKIVTLEEYNRLVRSSLSKNDKLDKLRDNNKLLRENLELMRENSKRDEELIKTLTRQRDSALKERDSALEKLKSFTNQQGKGRPNVLGDKTKQAIWQMYNFQKEQKGKINISEIHNFLVTKGYTKADYETVRKYIRESEDAGRAL